MSDKRDIRWQLNNHFTPLRNKMADPDTDAELLNSTTANAMHTILAGQELSVHNGNGGGDDGNPPSSGMSEEEFLAAFRAQYVAAKEFLEGIVIPRQAAALRAYRGEGPIIEEEGRSRVVMTEVRDTILAIMPSLLRIFTSSDQPVEFVPSNSQSVDIAQQMTDYISYVFMNDNPGFINLSSSIEDGLVQGMGVLKYRWSEDKEITGYKYTGITAEQIAMYIQSDPTIEMSEAPVEEPSVQPQPGTDPTTGQPLQAPPVQQTYTFSFRRSIPKSQAIIESLPPEEFMVAPDATTLKTASFVAHVRDLHVSDVVAMGYDRDTVEEYRGGDNHGMMNAERLARNPLWNMPINTPDESMQKVRFIEAFVKVDKDKDGVAELHKIHALGDASVILSDEIVSRIPFSIFCPVPSPHTIYGQSVADQTMDLQDIKTNVVRNGLDSYALSVHPRTLVLRGQANIDDVMNTEPGAFIEIFQPGAVTELTKTFDGQSLIGVLNYLDQIKAKRTGISDASQGLDPNVLQGAATEGVVATVTGAQERMELYARYYAELCLAPLFEGLADLLRENQDMPRTIKLNGKWVNVDPRTWMGDLDCIPNVALGKGTDMDKLKFLSVVKQSIEGYIQNPAGGPFNPVAGIDKLSYVLQKMLHLGGFKNTDAFVNDITSQQMQQMQQAQANQPHAPDPALITAQAAAAQAQVESTLALDKFKWQQQMDLMDQQRLRDKDALDATVKLETAYLQAGKEINQGAIDQMIQHTNDQATHNLEVVKTIMAAQSGPTGPVS